MLRAATATLRPLLFVGEKTPHRSSRLRADTFPSNCARHYHPWFGGGTESTEGGFRLAKSAAASKANLQSQPAPESEAPAEVGSDSRVVASHKPGDAPLAGHAQLDLNSFAKSREALDQQLKFWALAIEDTGRSWRQLDEQVASASGELLRLREIEKEFQKLSVSHAEGTKSLESLRIEFAETRSKEAAANDRANKLEDICEQIKERALEIHNSLQATRASEQGLQGEVTAIRSELVELRRRVQEEESGRVAAEETNAKLQAAVAELESVEAEARNRVARLTEDNKVMSQKLPQLAADASSWHKQFSASERENTRMQSERKMSAGRVAELEDEIRTLRLDLASIVKGSAERPADDVTDAAIEAQLTDLGLDEMDLVSSLDRAFSADEELDGPDRKI